MSKISPDRPAKGRARLLVVGVTAISREGIRAMDLVGQHRPDLLLIEPFAEGRDGVLLIKDLKARYPGLRILAISLKSEEVYAERILRAGACGYWMKSGPSEELIRAIETCLSGEFYLSQRMGFFAVRKLVDAPRSSASPVGGLTDRELHVFGLIGAGHGTGRIAEQLGISRKTVETHQEHIKTKLCYRNAGELRDGARSWFDELEK
ncbi:MAG: response regulator transcription factor [Chthoniobacterales bacterium]